MSIIDTIQSMEDNVRAAYAAVDALPGGVF